jgi:hypothetical protein
MNWNTLPRLSRRAFAGGIASGLVLGPAAWAQATPVQAIAEDYYRGIFALFPLEATENTGDPAYESAFENDLTAAHRGRQ